MLGADYSRIGGALPEPAEDHLVGTLRLRPVEGLYLRGGVDGRFDGGGLQDTAFTAGIELYLGGLGAGYAASSDQLGTGQTLMLGTDEPGESLLRSGRRVPSLRLSSPPPYQPRGGLLFNDDRTSWLDTLELLRRLEDDPGVRGLVLTLDGASLSLARARELRERIAALQSRDKPVLVYLTGSPANTDYYVASAAARIAMHPAADLQLTGLSAEMTFFRGLMDLVGVQAQFVKRGDYKTAPEQYTEVEPTPANLEMTEALLDDLYADLVGGIAAGRKVDDAVVRGWIDGGPHSADEALQAGLVDVLLYPDQVDDELEKLHQGSVSTSELDHLPQPHSPWEDPKQIAVIYVEGGIVSGDSARGGLFSGRTAGSASVVRQLNRARTDPQVRAVVMRVDSPGGSSFASDEIWRATQRLRSKGKPLVVSMGSVAASGGYYVAAGSDAIWAEPSTITGSIGVFGGKFSTEALQDRLGVTSVAVGRGRTAASRRCRGPGTTCSARGCRPSSTTPTPSSGRVADGRSLDPGEVEDIARGRVWSGAAAKERSLVDDLGGFQDAIADARSRAGIKEANKVGLVEFTESGDLLQSLAPAITQSARGIVRALQPDPPAARVQEQLEALGLVGPDGAFGQALLPVLHPDEQVWLLDPYVLRIGGR
ncbi:MAG: S49 family peptidase [Myxococcota bacterium]